MIIKETRTDNYNNFIEITGLFGKSALPEDFIFFDTETTGLDASSDMVFLIGTMFVRDGKTVILQYFSEGASDEINLLSSFFRLLSGYKYMVSYNGEGFDMRFIRQRLLFYNNLSDSQNIFPDDIFKNITGIDIYTLFKRFSSLLCASSFKQKNMELYCGHSRNDNLNGPEIIDAYLKYLAAAGTEAAQKRINDLYGSDSLPIGPFRNHEGSGLVLLGPQASEPLLKLLLNHNTEDLCGILSLKPAVKFLRDITRPEKYEITFSDDYSAARIDITLSTDTAEFINTHLHGSICGEKISIPLPCIQTRLKLFYDNYRDYYYIPGEDTAIHKSVASFMDASLRQKAAPQNCYTWYEGSFLHFPSDIFCKSGLEKLRIFRSEYRSRDSYIELKELMAATGSPAAAENKSNTGRIISEYLIEAIIKINKTP